MTTLEQLLRKWAELEPGRCNNRLGDGYTVDLGSTLQTVDKADTSPGQAALLLAAIVEAIEARGWDWALTNASVRLIGERICIATVDSVAIKASTPTKALLAAYVALLKGEASE